MPYQKEKKEKKSKHRDKSRKRKIPTDESDQSEDEVDPPKLKKSRSKVKQNGHAREESPENTRLSSLNVKSTHKKQHSNSSETSSGDSEQEQVKLTMDLVDVFSFQLLRGTEGKFRTGCLSCVSSRWKDCCKFSGFKATLTDPSVAYLRRF